MSKSEEARGQHEQIGVLEGAEDTNRHTEHPDAQWFSEAGVGVFIHWGISSVQGDGDLSWSMMKRNPGFSGQAAERYGPFAVQRTVTPRAYWEQAKGFLAENYEPRRWAEALAKARVRYAVLTTKHHDGFALWPSEFGELNTKLYLGGRDLVGEFAVACREVGLKVGFYYSPPDWYVDREVMSFHYGNAKPDLDIDHRPVDLTGITEEQMSEHRARRSELVKGQTEELLTRYGKVDILWFDGSADNAISLERIRELQPGIIVNRRGLGIGDFETPECSFPKARIEGWWEYCHIWNDGAWGYLNHETYKPLGWATGELAKARAWGGNMLLNLGPNSRGELPDTAYRRLAGLGDWLERNGESVFGVEAGPWPERSNVPVTVRGKTWYLHIGFTVDYPVVLKSNAAVKSARWLGSGREVSTRRVDGEFLVELGSGDVSIEGGVVVVEWEVD